MSFPARLPVPTRLKADSPCPPEAGALAQAPAARPLLEVVCAWCKAVMSCAPCEPALAGKRTHGICGDCADKFRGGAA